MLWVGEQRVIQTQMNRRSVLSKAAIGGLFCCFLVLQGFAPARAAQSLEEVPFPKEVQARFEQEGISGAEVSAYAVPIAPYVSKRPQAYTMGNKALVNPASVTKIFTTGLALEKLGSVYRFKTGFHAASPPVNGTLNGPLYIRGSGDPAFQTTNLWSALRQLRMDGLKTISGGVILDRTAFPVTLDDVSLSDTQDFDDAPYRAYHAQPDALLLNQGAMALRIEVGESNVRVVPLEAPRNWAFVSELRVNNAVCGAWKNGLLVDYKKSGSDVVVTLRGDYPRRCGQTTLPIRIAQPDWLWESWFREIWKELGGELTGPVLAGQTPAGTFALHTVLSNPLGDLIKPMNKYSSNVTARHLELALATSPGSFNANLLAWLNQQGIPTRGWVFENGSGLARGTRIDVRGLTDFLVHMSNRPDFPDFLASLPKAGTDGTLSRRLKEIQGFAYMKTGSLNGVQSLAGYVRDMQGQWWAVGVVVQSAKAFQAWKPMENLIEMVYKTK